MMDGLNIPHRKASTISLWAYIFSVPSDMDQSDVSCTQNGKIDYHMSLDGRYVYSGINY